VIPLCLRQTNNSNRVAIRGETKPL
jgi:hypothetical protein